MRDRGPSRPALLAVADATLAWLAFGSVNLSILLADRLVRGDLPIHHLEAASIMRVPLWTGLVGLGVSIIVLAVGRTFRARSAPDLAWRIGLAILPLAVLWQSLSAIAVAWRTSLLLLGAVSAAALWFIVRSSADARVRLATIPFAIAVGALAILDDGSGASIVVWGALAAFLLALVSSGSRRALAAWAIASLLLSAGLLGATPHLLRTVPASRDNAPRINTVILLLDTVRADHLSLYGYEKRTTPNLERLAEQSAVYRHSFSTSDTTLATHASLFTGLYSARHGAHLTGRIESRGATWALKHGAALSERFDTLAEQLQRAGVWTVAMAANSAYVVPEFGFAQGFDYFCSNDPFPPAQILPKLSPLRLIDRVVLPAPVLARHRRTDELLAEATQVLRIASAADRPLFLFVNLMDAHIPYDPPPPFDSLYPGKIKRFNRQDHRELEERVMRGGTLTEREVNHLISQYDGAIAYMDASLGRFVEWLKKRELYEDTLLIITSDHGEAFGERGLITHGMSVYQDQIHVPLVIRFPGLRRAQRIDEPASTVDLMPTILDLMTGRIPRGLDGISLAPGRAGATRLVLSESYPCSWWPDVARLQRTERAAIRAQMKIIVSTLEASAELYDLARDPGERANLCAPAAPHDECDPLAARVRELAAEMTSQAPPTAPPHLDEEHLQRLRSLGYIN